MEIVLAPAFAAAYVVALAVFIRWGVAGCTLGSGPVAAWRPALGFCVIMLSLPAWSWLAMKFMLWMMSK